MSVKRKSMREIRLEERTTGFYECLGMFEELNRQLFWKEYNRRRTLGLSTLVDKCTTPELSRLWDVIEKAQKKISPLENEYKDLMLKRCYGEDYDND